MTLNAVVPVTFAFLMCCHGVASRKNVVILVADDLGKDIQVYESRACKTPHLVSLASRGVVYDKAWTAASSCSPSRASILTGLPPHQNGMYGLYGNVNNFQSLTRIRTLPQMLEKKNIRTGIIGKDHIGPTEIYPFNFSETAMNNNSTDIHRNISLVAEYVRIFLNSDDTRPFFLVVGFGDSHKCGKLIPTFGQFCEKYGNGEPQMGTIPDWKPTPYHPDEVHVPYYIKDDPAIRDELVALYTSISRLDQGIGLVMEELKRASLLDDTLVIFTSDHGPAYPRAKTNTYEPGLQVPLIVSSPEQKHLWNFRSDDLVTLLDITPTVLDWFSLEYPKYFIRNQTPQVELFGKSLLLRKSEYTQSQHRHIYASHTHHVIQMYYPMRALRTQRFKLIHNLAYQLPFPSGVNATLTYMPLNQTTIQEYYYRPEWEMFDLLLDPTESNNIANRSQYTTKLNKLKDQLKAWMNDTQDPFINYITTPSLP